MHTARQFSCYALSRVVYRLNLLLAVAGLTWLFEGGTRGLTVVGRVGTRDMLEWHKARVSGVTGVYTPLLRRLRHTHKKKRVGRLYSEVKGRNAKIFSHVPKGVGRGAGGAGGGCIENNLVLWSGPTIYCSYMSLPKVPIAY